MTFERQTIISVFLILSGLKGIFSANYDKENYSWKHRMEYKGLRRLNGESNFWYPGRITDEYRDYSASNPFSHGVTSKQLPKEYHPKPLKSDFSDYHNENSFKHELFRNQDRRRPVNPMERNHHFHSNNFDNRKGLIDYRDPFDNFNQQQPVGNLDRPGRPFGFDEGIYDNFNPREFMLGGATARPPAVGGVPGTGTTVSPCEQSCQTTMQFDPVCGDNDFTYQNLARFKCAVACGKRVKIRRMGACSVPQ
ncbi:unnamed protein product [Phyllotreta striolata]|uniref:Kazal-like domain-containing protein n=1 Tax=Phyllotreta striolata TaxID=444603 RepID=A0A9N9TNS0_PHYSR|nr:unnamed protein product [Phyllotreta striolata]